LRHATRYCGFDPPTRSLRENSFRERGTHAYAAWLNAIRKYVFSSSLETAEWNNSTIVRGDDAAEVTKLKQQDGGDLLLLGHGLLGETLLQRRLIDVLDLSILCVRSP